MNVAAPPSIEVGDILRVAAFIDDTVTVTSMPAGWANAASSPQLADFGVDHRLYVMWKRAEVGDVGASTFDFTLSASTYRNAQCSNFRNAIASGDPWEVVDGNVHESTSSAPVEVTVLGDNRLLCWVATAWSGPTWSNLTAGFTMRRNTGDLVCSEADKVQDGAGDSGTVSATFSGNTQSVGWLGALKPAGEAAAGVVELEGSINIASQHSGTASLDLPLAGGSNAASALTGLTGLAIPVAGKADAASALTGNLRLVAAAAGHVDAASQHTAAANVGYSLAGNVNAASLHTGAASVSYALAGSVNAASQHSGALSVALTLQGQVHAASDLDGLTGLALPVAGNINAAVGMTGLISTPVALAGNVNAAALLTGEVEVTQFEFLEGSINATMTLSGATLLAQGLAGSVSAASLLSAGVGVNLGLGGSVPASLLLTGDATATRQLIGSIDSAFVLLEIVIRSIHIYGVSELSRHWGYTGELRGRQFVTQDAGVRWSASEAVDHRHSVSEPVGRWSAGELRRS